MDKNNDIIQMLRDREDEFHLPLREEDWKKLEAGLIAGGQASQPLLASTSVVRRLPRMWWKVAAVGFLCLLVGLPFFMHKGSENTLSDKSQKEVSQSEKLSEPALSGQPEEKQLAQENNAAKQKPAKVIPAVLPELMPELQLTDTTVILPQPTELYASKDIKKTHKHVGPQPERKQTVFDYQLGDSKQIQKQRWSFGIQGGSNALSNMNGGLSHMEGIVSDPGPKPHPDPEPPITDPGEPDDSPSSGSPQTKAAVGNGGGSGSSGNQDIYYYYRHRLPVTISLSLRHNFFRQFALETGLSYTYLHSDILEERKEDIGSQRLHYIGIPLKLNWTFYQRERFSLYASGGGLIEYCVSAVNTEKELNICRWQPSWNAAVGMQMTVLKSWSLYVEPGISYFYFMNRNIKGSYNRFETIRTVHPLTFNLQVGLRFTY